MEIKRQPKKLRAFSLRETAGEAVTCFETWIYSVSFKSFFARTSSPGLSAVYQSKQDEEMLEETGDST